MNTSEMNTIVNPLFEVNNNGKNLEQENITPHEKKDNLTAEEKFILMKEIEIKTENKMKELYKTGELIPPLSIILGAICITPEVGKQQMDLLEKIFIHFDGDISRRKLCAKYLLKSLRSEAEKCVCKMMSNMSRLMSESDEDCLDCCTFPCVCSQQPFLLCARGSTCFLSCIAFLSSNPRPGPFFID